MGVDQRVIAGEHSRRDWEVRVADADPDKSGWFPVAHTRRLDSRSNRVGLIERKLWEPMSGGRQSGADLDYMLGTAE